MAVIYKLTREDGLEYIGITKRLKERLADHAKSPRFSKSKLAKHEILFEGTYDECETLEEVFIEKYDTFNRGLNCTRRGKGRSECDGFNTTGFVFSDESRMKMSAAAKARGPNNTGMVHSELTKKRWSEIRRGKIWAPVKIDPETLINMWNSFTITPEIVSKYCKKSQKSLTGTLPLSELRTGGGHPITKRLVFSKEVCTYFNSTPSGIIVALEKHGIRDSH